MACENRHQQLDHVSASAFSLRRNIWQESRRLQHAGRLEASYHGGYHPFNALPQNTEHDADQFINAYFEA